MVCTTEHLPNIRKNVLGIVICCEVFEMCDIVPHAHNLQIVRF
jgi:hypothetical protein